MGLAGREWDLCSERWLRGPRSTHLRKDFFDRNDTPSRAERRIGRLCHPSLDAHDDSRSRVVRSAPSRTISAIASSESWGLRLTPREASISRVALKPRASASRTVDLTQ